MTDKSYPARLRARIFLRDTRLQELGFANYDDYIRSPSWKRKKERHRKLGIQRCCLCPEVEGLHLHHLTYERVGREDHADLAWLCRGCHTMVHELERNGLIELDFGGMVNFQRAARYAIEGQERERRMAALPAPQSPTGPVQLAEIERLTIQRNALRRRLSKRRKPSPVAVSVLARLESRIAVLAA